MSDEMHDALREALLDALPDELPEDLKAHWDECDECREFGEALFLVDARLEALPPIEAPLDLITRTQLAVDELPREAPPEPAPASTLSFFGAILAGLLSGIGALIALLFAPFRQKRRLAILVPALGALGLVFLAGIGTLFTLRMEAPVRSAPTPVSSSDSQLGWLDNSESMGDSMEDAPPPADPTDLDGDDDLEGLENAYFRYGDDGTVGRDRAARLAERPRVEATREGYRGEPEVTELPSALEEDEEEVDLIVRNGPAPARVMLDGRAASDAPVEVDIPAGRYQLELRNAREHERGQPAFHSTVERQRQIAQDLDALGYAGGDEVDRRLALDDGESAGEGEATGQRADAHRGPHGSRPTSSTRIPRTRETTTTERGDVGGAEMLARERASEMRALDDEFAEIMDETNADTGVSANRWGERDRFDALTFQPATGYWANTYVPGDPAIRTLRRRLADHPNAVRIAQLAQPGAPGMEAPRSGALALHVTADRTAVEGRSRVLMSVGLRAAEQRAGRRPQLRAQVVLDLRRPLDADGQARVRALLSSLSRRRDGADQVGVIVAGPDGGQRVSLGGMRFGEVSVALRRIFGSAPADATPLSLRDALARAVTSVGQLEDDAPLGSSMVLLVTPGLAPGDASTLAGTAHTGALAGVTTTVVGLDDSAVLEPLERVALAGQGRRRVLESAGAADGLVREEITAVSRVVARAVRLRIRLADGVQLVDVLGSRRLDAQQAQRVREAEQAVDRTLARQLGITSDRGEDEDGIQIVVPAFYADDSHRVLLDLVVPGPGAVADVQARFKDLLRLGNGTLTERLVLSRGAAARGPAQRAVYAAWLGHEVAAALRRAARELDAGRAEAARTILSVARGRLEAETDAMPELASDPALTRDASLYQRFDAALGTQPNDVLARTLRYAAHRRLLGDPLGLGGEP